MKKMTHYGIEVVVQYCDDFRSELKKVGVSYADLPILEHDVLSYSYNGKRMFAVIKPCGEGEKVYLTEQIPVDMSWENLITDCDGQGRGEDPMKLHTKAFLMLQTATKLALDAKNRSTSFSFSPLVQPTAREVAEALISVGTTVDRLLDMDHHDIDDDILDELRRA